MVIDHPERKESSDRKISPELDRVPFIAFWSRCDADCEGSKKVSGEFTTDC